jgi:hypothetical protein
MALGDIKLYDEGAYGYPGEVEFAVASGSAASIKAGEPVTQVLGSATVASMATNKPVVGTDYLAGIAASTSTDTASAAGTVRVTKLVPGVSYLIAPKVAATFATQSAYNALVGDRVLLDLTAGVYTILASDSANNGCVILPLDISKYPGQVRFAIRAGANFLA